MSPGYPAVPLRRGDIYLLSIPSTERSGQRKQRPALILRDERLEPATRSLFTLVAYGTSQPRYANHPLALAVDPAIVTSLSLSKTTYFLAYRIHAVDKKTVIAGQPYLGRLPQDFMDTFDELLTLALQIGEYPFP